MSDDTPNCAETDTDCREALAEVYRYLDGELTTDDRSAISSHLDDCAPCLRAFEFHDDLKALVSTRCRTEAPPELRSRVLDALRSLDS